MPVITDISILPWNFTLLRRSRSSKCVSYSPFISASDDSMEYFLVSVMPFCSKSSSLRRYLNFSRRSSSLVICGCASTGASGFNGTLLNLPNPSHVFLSSSAEAVELPKLKPLLPPPNSIVSSLNDTLFPDPEPPPPPPPAPIPLKNKDLLDDELGPVTSLNSFNSASSAFKSPMSMSLSPLFPPPPLFSLSFMRNSSPPPKLEDLLPPNRESLGKFEMSITSSICTVYAGGVLLLSILMFNLYLLSLNHTQYKMIKMRFACAVLHFLSCA